MIRILHLFPDLMNLYGDYGNVMILTKHLNDQGIEVKVDKKNIEDVFDLGIYDFIYMGAGNLTNQKIALRELKKQEKQFKEAVENKKVILFTGNSMELLGQKIDEQQALGIFNFTVKNTDKRFTGDVIVKNNEYGELVGFINKASQIDKDDEDHHLFKMVFKDSNLPNFEYEGYRINNTFASEIIGPILVKNPLFLKEIIKLLLDKNIYQELNYPYETKSYEISLKALKERNN